jgi:hypothetical protein
MANMPDDDLFRYLCAALLKASGGQPVTLDDEETRAGFGLKIKLAGDGLVIQVAEEDGEE